MKKLKLSIFALITLLSTQSIAFDLGDIFPPNSGRLVYCWHPHNPSLDWSVLTNSSIETAIRVYICENEPVHAIALFEIPVL